MFLGRGDDPLEPYEKHEKRLMILMFIVGFVMLLAFLRRLFA